MYSLMLAAALTTGAAAPDCCWFGGCAPCGYYGWYGCGYPCAYPPWYGGWGYYPYYYPYYGYYSPWCGSPSWPVASVRVVTVAEPAPRPQPAPEAREKALREELERLMNELRKRQETKPRQDETAAPAPARVIVKLPEDARLFVDDDPCPLTTATRAFNTPELRPGVTYQYTIRAELTREGRAVTQSKRVTVRAGEETVVEFGAMRAVEAASR